MTYQLVRLHTGPAEKITHGEAIQYLVDAGATLASAVALIDALPCGFRIGVPGLYGWGSLIQRLS